MRQPLVIVVECGISNTGSLLNMLRRLGILAEASSDPDRIARAEKLILPGVGAFDAGMQQLEVRGLREPLDSAHRAGTPILGVCLGMQMSTRGSEEGTRPGLGWVDADTIRMRPKDPSLKIPHMGWNKVEVSKPSPLFDADAPDQSFYFVHSYSVSPDRDEDVLGRTWHGENFCSAISADNVVGVQFHPEKSHRYGLAFLRRFYEQFGAAHSRLA